MNEDGKALADLLMEHGPSGFVNSREGWVGCLCGERLPCVFEDGDPAYEAEELVRARHVAEALVPMLDQARRDALAPVLALIDGQDIVWYGSEQWLQRLRAAAAAASPDTESGPMVEIGDEQMTQAQFDAARRHWLDGEVSHAPFHDEARWSTDTESDHDEWCEAGQQGGDCECGNV